MKTTVKYTTACVVDARWKLKSAKRHAKAGHTALARERALGAHLTATECIANCRQSFGRWEQAYKDASEIASKAEKLLAKLKGR